MTLDSYSALLQSGNALVAQAQAVATQDFAAARALWRQAGDFFLSAHEAEPEQHTAAFRLGQAWIAEAHAPRKHRRQTNQRTRLTERPRAPKNAQESHSL